MIDRNKSGRNQQAIIDKRETFIFTEDQLVSTLERTIELYLIYSIASSEKPATDAAIIAVLQGLNADQQLADLLERYPLENEPAKG